MAGMRACIYPSTPLQISHRPRYEGVHRGRYTVLKNPQALDFDASTPSGQRKTPQLSYSRVKRFRLCSRPSLRTLEGLPEASDSATMRSKTADALATELMDLHPPGWGGRSHVLLEELLHTTIFLSVQVCIKGCLESRHQGLDTDTFRG